MNRDVAKCIAVVRSNNIGSGALNILRFDNDIDENNFRISTFETQFGPKSKYYKKFKKLHENLFTGNVNNFAVRNHIFANQTLRPVGFFRKIPKGPKCFLVLFYFILFLLILFTGCVFVLVFSFYLPSSLLIFNSSSRLFVIVCGIIIENYRTS